MARTRFAAEQIIHKLREAYVLIGQGLKVPEVCRRLGVSDKTYYRWRSAYGGMKVDQAKRLCVLDAPAVGRSARRFIRDRGPAT